MPDIARRPRYFEVSPGVDLDAVADAMQAPDAPPPAPARPSSTVMMVRDAAAGGVEVFMLRRVAAMAFAPRAMVFPGGGVDARDADADLPWSGPSPHEWSRWLGATHDEARELVVAAAREVFEESGILLAGVDEHSVVGDVSSPEWHAERDRLLSRDQSFAEMLIRRGLVLRTDLLHPWAHWITPEFEPRRYDTRFFVAEVPAGQVPDDRTSEADLADWVRPATLIEDAAAGRALLLPPTLVCVEQVASAPSVAHLLRGAPPMAPVMPVVERLDGGPARLRADLPGHGPDDAADDADREEFR